MKKCFKLLFFVLCFLLSESTHSQSFQIPVTTTQWNSKWIAASGDQGRDYGVYYFRKNIKLEAKPAVFKIHVSADNRYKLYVNGKLVSLGPARGDLYYWNYETVDLAPYLTTGKNTIAALVFNEAEYRPEAQITLRTAFILQGSSKIEEILNTDNSWKCIRDRSYNPLWGFFAASTGEQVDMNLSVKDWASTNLDDSTWPAAAHLFDGKLKGTSDGFGWMLVPSSLPQMELTYQRIPVLRKVTGITVSESFPKERNPLVIPAHTKANMLLDQTYLTNAYLTLIFSKGKGAGISLRYAESLFDNISKFGGRKSNRNEVEGKEFSGRKDSLIADGTDKQTFTTLNYRTYRYISLTVQTGNEPLIIDDIYGTFTGYPFKQHSVFITNNQEIKNILDIGWRTARLNAMETYMDCPYYEQLQYIGDARVQAMITYYNSSDDRLARNALNLMDHSRLTDGVTLSRYPTHSTQVIPTFSLWYIGMLHDYWMYRPDSSFVKDKLEGERAILSFFSKYQQEDGSLKDTPYWTFVDWASGQNWWVGAPPKGADGSTAILDLQLLWAYQWAMEMESKLGMASYAALYQKKATQLKEVIQRKYWDPVKGLYADTKEKTMFSQHANSLAILTGMVRAEDMPSLGKKLLTDVSLTQCTIYFKYYLHQALVKSGMGNDYVNWLDIWRENIKMGLTTWAEDSNVPYARSDCHAWGSSPNIEFYRTVLGVDSDLPGFKSIKIEPHLGLLDNVSGEIPHPQGKITVIYRFNKEKWNINISIPEKTTGVFIWKQKKYVLKAGKNGFVI